MMIYYTNYFEKLKKYKTNKKNLKGKIKPKSTYKYETTLRLSLDFKIVLKYLQAKSS